MKLNPDCVRDVLLMVESEQSMNANGIVGQISSDQLLKSALAEQYSSDDIVYSCKQLIDNGMLAGKEARMIRNVSYVINDISPAGHEFLENIRSNTTWKKTKEKASKVGSFALTALSGIASRIISDAIINS